jgi:serine/threonine protein kinase
MVDFDKVKIKKKLGAGMLGTTYLAEYKNKEYALKIQHILEKDKIKDYKNEMWRELDLYKFINKLNKEDQVFFTKLYDYKIYNNCSHIQKRPFDINNNSEFAKKLKELDESEWCLKYLLDYKGNNNLNKFLIKNKLTEKQILSILIQVCKIILILYEAGYSHNDLHPGNIMINKTNKKYFNFMNKQIPYHGYQISAIDYGEVLHKKFGMKLTGSQKLFDKDITKYMFIDMFYSHQNIISNLPKYINDCEKAKKLMPWEHKINTFDIMTKKMITNYNDFYKISKVKYLKIYPKAEKLLNYVESKIKNKKVIRELVKNKKNIRELVKNKKYEEDFWDVLNRIVIEFNLYYPKDYSKYQKWCSYHEYLLPKDIILNMLIFDNHIDYVNYLVMKCLEIK